VAHTHTFTCALSVIDHHAAIKLIITLRLTWKPVNTLQLTKALATVLKPSSLFRNLHKAVSTLTIHIFTNASAGHENNYPRINILKTASQHVEVFLLFLPQVSPFSRLSAKPWTRSAKPTPLMMVSTLLLGFVTVASSICGSIAATTLPPWRTRDGRKGAPRIYKLPRVDFFC